MEATKLEPLSAEDLPAAVANVVAGATAAKMMVVRGMAPLRPAELLIAVYQLSFDADASVKAAADGAPGGLPEKLLLGPLAERLPPAVLHFFAVRLPPARRKAIETVLYNQATADETFVELARRLDESRLEIIFQNEVRLLRCPPLVEALYLNKKARMSSVSRALELCVRNNVRPEGIPGFDEFAAALLADPNAVAPSVADEAFTAALSQGDNVAVTEAPTDEGLAGLLGEEGDEDVDGGEQGQDLAAGAAFIKFDKLKIFEKIRLATVGNAYCRHVLIRDTNKIVAMAVVRSPSITDMEIVAAASNRGVCDDVIRYIANNRTYIKDYAVKLSLVNNPKCPLGNSLRLLSFLHPEDLRALSRSKNVPAALATAAKKLMQTRSIRGG